MFLVRSFSSMSSNSSISTRTSSKYSEQQQPKASFKCSVSPIITLAVERSAEKRRRQREQRKARTISSSSVYIKINDDTEQENDNDDRGDNSTVTTKSNQSKQQLRNKQRKESNNSVEYVQTLNHNQPSVSSLNNIENLKVKSKINDKETIICHSTSSVKEAFSSPNKNHWKTSVNGTDANKTSSDQVIFDSHFSTESIS